MTPSQDHCNVTNEFHIGHEGRAVDTNNSDYNLKDIEDRLKTYNNWPLTFLTKETLAAAGFFFTGKEDIVKCAFCQVEIGRWDRDDDPEGEHRKFSSPSKCQFLLWSKSTTPQDYSIDEQHLSLSEQVEDTCGPFGLDGVKQALLKHDKMTRATLGDSYHNSTFVSVDENYMYYGERLKTFDGWPSDSKISKEALSEAGFIYRQDEDHTSCFHCGGALRKWEETDDPWEEHAGWFPDCKFVLTMKGQTFVSAARAKRLAINRSTNDNSERMVTSRSST